MSIIKPTAWKILTRNCGRPRAVNLMAENPSTEAPPDKRRKNITGIYIHFYHSHRKTKNYNNSVMWSLKNNFILIHFLTHFTWGFDALYERLHLVVTFGLICVEVSTGANDTPAPVSKLTVGLVLLSTVIGTWRHDSVWIYDCYA